MSVLGVGVDIVFLPDFAKAMKQKGFLKRVFTPREIQYCKSRPASLRHFAARFAVKEAAYKAIGKPLSYRLFEVQNASSGKPLLTLKPPLSKKVSCQASMSHTGEYALAVVICQIP